MKKERFSEFRKRYWKELEGKKEEIQEIISIAEKTPVTLVYSAKDTETNQAVVLQQYLISLKKHPSRFCLL